MQSLSIAIVFCAYFVEPRAKPSDPHYQQGAFYHTDAQGLTLFSPCDLDNSNFWMKNGDLRTLPPPVLQPKLEYRNPNRRFDSNEQ